MANFYIVMSRETSWGIGKTREQAVQSAAQRVPGQDNEQGISIEEMENLITSRHEAELHRSGYYLEPISLMEWDDKLVDIHDVAIARLAWEQQWYNSLAPRNPVIDTQYRAAAADVAWCINAPHDIEIPIELIAAAFALNAAREAGRGFSKEEIEYHLNVLAATRANFAYAIALGRAMSIASLIHDE